MASHKKSMVINKNELQHREFSNLIKVTILFFSLFLLCFIEFLKEFFNEPPNKLIKALPNHSIQLHQHNINIPDHHQFLYIPKDDPKSSRYRVVRDR